MFWKPGTSAPGIDRGDFELVVHNQNPHLALQDQRRLLPIHRHREQLLFLIETFQVLVLVGQTGSGKTTQLPQFLADAGWTSVVCTQPRRVACTSVAARVALEADCALGQLVGYKVNFDEKLSLSTRILYTTDDMLFRECLVDPLLKRFSVIMIDEAHERTLYTDLLLGLLKKIVRKRPDLRVIVSSATIDTLDIYRFFSTCTSIFNSDADSSSLSKTVPGTSNDKAQDNCIVFSIPGRMFPVDLYYLHEPALNYVEEAIDTVFKIHNFEKQGDILVFLTTSLEVDTCCSIINTRGSDKRLQPIYALPLYAGLPVEEQQKAFETPLPGTRKVVVSTSIAEASVTIEGILYVVDCGFVRLKAFNSDTSIERLVITPISQSAAIQRAGRAGRTKPGKCFRLYTEDTFNNLCADNVPEMQRSNLAHAILQLKAVGIDNLLAFDFFSPPPKALMAKALELLYSLNALDEQARLTSPLGHKLAELPLEPMVATMLLNSARFKCSQEALTIAAMTSVENIFLSPPKQASQAKRARGQFAVEEGDLITYINVYDAFINSRKSQRFCINNFLNYQALSRAVAVRRQLATLLKQAGICTFESCKTDLDALLKCIVSGFFSHCAKLQPNGSYATVRDNHILHIHPESVLANRSPPWVLYHEVQEASKAFMRDVTVIEPEWLTELAYFV